MSESKQNTDEPTFDERRSDPPPYSDPPTIPVTNQPQMSMVYQTGPAVSVGVVAGQPGVMTGMAPVGMVTGQAGTMTAVAPGFIVLNQMMYQPTPYTCNSCHQQIVTNVKRKPTFKTHFFAAGFCLVCCIPCAIIPYCIDGCRQADHYCPNCDSFIGSYIP